MTRPNASFMSLIFSQRACVDHGGTWSRQESIAETFAFACIVKHLEPLKPLGLSQHYRIEGFGPPLYWASHCSERRSSLQDSQCKFFQSGFETCYNPNLDCNITL